MLLLYLTIIIIITAIIHKKNKQSKQSNRLVNIQEKLSVILVISSYYDILLGFQSKDKVKHYRTTLLEHGNYH